MVYNSKDVLIIFLIYVDDILVTGNNAIKIQSIINKFHANFTLKGLGKIGYFLWIEVIRSFICFHLSQRKYIRQLLKKALLQDTKPISILSQADKVLPKYNGKILSDASIYRTIFGTLQHYTWTHIDIFYSVNKLCQFHHYPTTKHWSVAKRSHATKLWVPKPSSIYICRLGISLDDR